jgi:hypothetical protein
MLRFALSLLVAAWVAGPTATARADDDLLHAGKTDSAIKLLRFPLSMGVIEARPENGGYFISAEEEGQKIAEPAGTIGSDLDSILSAPRLIKKTLLGIDPARVTTATLEPDLRGPVSRSALEIRSEQTGADLLLVFRREIYLVAETHHQDEILKQPEYLPGDETGTANPLEIVLNTQGLLYLARQNKVIVLKPNRQSATLTGGSRKKTLESAVAAGLRQLATQAKEAIRNYRFEKRRSNY